MAKFDLEKARNGAEIVTDRGYPARIIYWEAKGKYPLVALIEVNGVEMAEKYSVDGKPASGNFSDLKIISQKRTKWANLYINEKGRYFLGNIHLHNTKEEAESYPASNGFIKTIEITWEEE